MAEVPDRLQYPILVDLKIIFTEPGDERVVVVKNGCAQGNEVGIQFESVFLPHRALGTLGNLCAGNTVQKNCGNQKHQSPERERVSLRNVHSCL